MMNARTRRTLMDEMVQEYDLTLVKALISTISEKTGVSCSQAADIVLTAWQHSKEETVNSDCYESAVALQI